MVVDKNLIDLLNRIDTNLHTKVHLRQNSYSEIHRLCRCMFHHSDKAGNRRQLKYNLKKD